MESVNETVTMTKEQFDQLMDRIQKLEESNKPTTSATVAPNTGTYNMQALTPVYRPAPKKSGWETFGKVAIGTAIGIVGTCIVSALTGGSSGGNTNTFGGSMPG